MKHKLLWSAAFALLLVGCSDDKEPAPKLETPPSVEQSEEVTPEETTISDEELAAFVEKAANEAFSTTEHEGSIVLKETHEIDGEVQQSYMHETTYRQNEAMEGMYGEHQLYYDRHVEGLEDGPTTFEGYVQPDVAFYKFNDTAGWNGYDFQTMGEIGRERIAYLSPADIMSMVEMNPASHKLVSVDQYSVTTTFEPTPEDQNTLLYSILEDESLYYYTDMVLQVKNIYVQLTFEKSNEVLSTIQVQIEFDNVDNEKETLMYSYMQVFTSYSLTDEIRPADAVFAESNLSLWD